MTRSEMLRRLESHPHAWDMIVVGGGATGVGVAIDAAARGYDVLLLEQSDFGKGTSSRSTKLAPVSYTHLSMVSATGVSPLQQFGGWAGTPGSPLLLSLIHI